MTPLLEAFKKELEALLARYPTVRLQVEHNIQAYEVAPAVPTVAIKPDEKETKPAKRGR